MLRRSLRLQEAGYYTEQGTPTVCYKEVICRVFQRRKGCVDSIDHHESIDNPQHTSNFQKWTTRYSRYSATRPIKFIKWLFPLLWSAYQLIHFAMLCMQLNEVQQELQIYKQQMIIFAPDTIPNFASESQGARVLHHLSSDTYWPQKDIGIVWDKIFYWWYSPKAQRRVIQGHSPLQPGNCWTFSGEQGHLFISLSHRVSITKVTLGHIAKSQSIHGHIASAPREFSVYGLRTEDEEGTFLGKLVYDQDGAAFQTFDLPNPEQGAFRHVMLRINNNWGNVDYTCLYSFRVHGN
ncbi:SUN domain-containing protein 2-like isoform X2 [Cottoperca gobio]|nr:SUN domain-containing protein 2-like isoform X2 [Cottoperca gobio]